MTSPSPRRTERFETTNSHLDPEIAALLGRADEELGALRGAGSLPLQKTEQLRSTFERCAALALRRPNPVQRSLVLRAVVRKVVPKSLRPMLKRVLVGIRGRGTR